MVLMPLLLPFLLSWVVEYTPKLLMLELIWSEKLSREYLVVIADFVLMFSSITWNAICFHYFSLKTFQLYSNIPGITDEDQY
jgi:hypothetical protein